MSNLLLIGALATGVYLLTKKPEVKKSTTTKEEPPKTGDYGAWWYKYDCKSLEIYNPAKWKTFIKEQLILVFKKLGEKSNDILDFDKFKNWVIPFVQDYIASLNENAGLSCQPLTEQEKYIYYILGAEAIEELFTLKYEGLNDLSPEYQKWGEVSQGYYNILKDYLNIAGKENEIIAAAQKLKTTGSYP